MKHAKTIYSKMRKSNRKAPDEIDAIKLTGNAIRRLVGMEKYQ
jgi:hypothetical protein